MGQNIVIENVRVSADRLKLEKGGKHMRSGLALQQISAELNREQSDAAREQSKSGLNIVKNGTLVVSDKDISSRGGSICSRRRTCSIPSSKDSKKKRRRRRNRRKRSQKENEENDEFSEENVSDSCSEIGVED